MKNPILFSAATCLMAACSLFPSCKNNSSPADPPAENITLETAVWQLTDILTDSVQMPVPDTLPVPITVKFSAGKMEGFGGCNGIGGNYTATGNQLTISGIISTKKYCEGASDWENSFVNSLQNSRSYAISGETLEIDCGEMGGLKFRLNWKKRNG